MGTNASAVTANFGRASEANRLAGRVLIEAPLVALVDVDSLCSELNGRVPCELIDALRMLEAGDVQIVLVSTEANELAASMHRLFQRPWWCARNFGWHDGSAPSRTTMPYETLLRQLRGRMPEATVLALSNDADLRTAVSVKDRVVTFGRAPTVGGAETLIRSIWSVINLRVHQRRHSR